MACNNCGAIIVKEWLFCPFCGFEVRKSGGLLDDIDKIVRNVMKNISGGVLSESIDGNKFTIKVNTMPSSEASSRGVQEERIIKLPDKLVEPNAFVKNFGSELEIVAKLPGVRSLDNISIKILSESVELKAVTKEMGYFKIINIPIGYRIINKSLKDELLVMRLGAK